MVFWRQLVESASDIMYRADVDGYFTYANPAAVRITGYAESELVGMHFTDLVRPDYREYLVAQYAKQIADQIPNTYFEFPITTRDGLELWVGQNVQLIWEGSTLVGVQAITRDITDRRETVAALQLSEARFRVVVESLGEGLLITDLEDVVIYANGRVAEITGYAPEELVGRVAYEVLLPPEERAKVRRETHSRAEGKESRYLAQHLRKDGTRVWVEVHGVPYRNGAGEVVGTLGLIDDITERKEAEEALERSERYFRSLIENALDVIQVINADRTTRYISPSVTRLLGYSAEELVGRDVGQIMHPDDIPLVRGVLRDLGSAGLSTLVEVRVRHRDGSWRTFEAVMRNLLDDPAVAGVVINSRDVTVRKRAEEESLRLAALARENPNPVLLCSASGQPLRVNPAAEQISRELKLETVTDLLPRNHEQLVRSALQGRERIQQVETDVNNRIFAWTYRPDPEARVVYLFAVDITGRRLMEEQLRHDALHDALTGLPNRLLFMERLSHAILRAKRREGYLFAVLFLDLDRFKVINDSLGHHVGDELLILVSQRLQQCLRTEDTVARFGGDEFAVLLEDIGGISGATRVAERIHAELSASVNLSGFDVFTSASIGIALSSSAYERPEYLLRNADMAMYRAKAAGQSRFEVFDRAMHAHALARLQLETDLRRAIEREEFLLYYQPIISLQSGRICGVEALVRWMHPDRGLMTPDEFIPIAEETGLILPIGRWVLGEVCRQGQQWRERFGTDTLASVAVNLSAKQFSQSDLVEQISGALRQSGLPASALQLEITESAVMENADTAVVLLGRLKSLGARISLDDFGTGYSSLSYLHRFPLDSLKIDRSFVGRINSEQRAAQLVQTVLTLARSLGVSAVAEGIETAEHLGTLRELSCDYGQGYHFARPLTAERMEELLASDQGW